MTIVISVYLFANGIVAVPIPPPTSTTTELGGNLSQSNAVAHSILGLNPDQMMIP